MKLESNLKHHASVLHAAPLLDVILLLLIFFLLGSNFVLRSGVSVDLPFSSSTLPPVASSHVITVSAGASPVIYLDDDRIALSALAEALNNLEQSSRYIILKADLLASYGVVMEISDTILGQGFELSLATTSRNQAP
ncbi:MAG: biopolymer transporter ExbD [Verrucomicrobiales bacterium]